MYLEGLAVPPDAVVELDASSSKKFSRHVIIRLSRCTAGTSTPGSSGGGGGGDTAAGGSDAAAAGGQPESCLAFSSNLAAGRFVHRAMAVLAAEAKTRSVRFPSRDHARPHRHRPVPPHPTLLSARRRTLRRLPAAPHARTANVGLPRAAWA